MSVRFPFMKTADSGFIGRLLLLRLSLLLSFGLSLSGATIWGGSFGGRFFLSSSCFCAIAVIERPITTIVINNICFKTFITLKYLFPFNFRGHFGERCRLCYCKHSATTGFRRKYQQFCLNSFAKPSLFRNFYTKS